MRLISALGVALLLLSSPVAARPRQARADSVVAVQGQTRFLGREPHGPLVVARGRKLEQPAGAACRTWGPRGSVWLTLDAFGRVVGKARVADLDRYDVTDCDELTMETVTGQAGAGIHASDGYRAAAVTPWKPTGKARKELLELIRQREGSVRQVALPIEQRMIAWKTVDGGTFAVVGGRTLTVLRREGATWKVLHRKTPDRADALHADMFRPLAVLDMNGDGHLEIVVHERDVDAYGDFTLTPTADGYREIVAGIHGAFA